MIFLHHIDSAPSKRHEEYYNVIVCNFIFFLNALCGTKLKRSSLFSVSTLKGDHSIYANLFLAELQFLNNGMTSFLVTSEELSTRFFLRNL